MPCCRLNSCRKLTCKSLPAIASYTVCTSTMAEGVSICVVYTTHMPIALLPCLHMYILPVAPEGSLPMAKSGWHTLPPSHVINLFPVLIHPIFQVDTFYWPLFQERTMTRCEW
ncbi:hypothetical protein IW261DRAFT_307105 [Armillaria novae-zelandiae]|uniref:Uncharacterized protein n=1 Tax=Armillaria novae-zelandiae TaxID=153914 RepID=A0AA39UCD8_9AGAR|nr:hypothetical protein IW261DRAFT_307105 [Armillaria novae-zelandiae]